MFKIKSWFTIVEMILSLTLFTIIILVAFQVLWNIWIMRIRISDNLDINKDLYYATENLVTSIKDFEWDIDYEEYWNRASIWTLTSSWHYKDPTWYGNYWSGWVIWDVTNAWFWDELVYVCRSWSWAENRLWSWWCLEWKNYSIYAPGTSVANAPNRNYKWKNQIYMEYYYQFIDLNEDYNDDGWDENNDWSPYWDKDDADMGEWPVAFSGNEVKELYLFKKWLDDTYERMFLRLNFILDPNAPTWATCDANWTWSWCLGNIQILKLVWKDLWIGHGVTDGNPFGRDDWKIDTWECNKDFSCTWSTNLPTWADSEWVNLLPNYINVKSLKFFLYPNKDYEYAWKDNDDNININPYLRLNIKIWFSWERKKQLKLSDPELNISTTINLNKN
jgi:hypothetical protein